MSSLCDFPKKFQEEGQSFTENWEIKFELFVKLHQEEGQLFIS